MSHEAGATTCCCDEEPPPPPECPTNTPPSYCITWNVTGTACARVCGACGDDIDCPEKTFSIGSTALVNPLGGTGGFITNNCSSFSTFPNASQDPCRAGYPDHCSHTCNTHISRCINPVSCAVMDGVPYFFTALYNGPFFAIGWRRPVSSGFFGQYDLYFATIYPPAGNQPQIVCEIDGTASVEMCNPDELGACCGESGCSIVSSTTPCNGTFLGPGSTCDQCPNPIGACCDGNGQCFETTEQACEQGGVLPGVWQGPNTTCANTTCPQPTGSCCEPNGLCTEKTLAECQALGGRWGGPDTSCSGQQCRSCCLATGECYDNMDQAQCVGLGGTAYPPGVPCNKPGPATSQDLDCNQTLPPGVGGACCIGGNCYITTQEDCENQNGEFQGNGTTCGHPFPCSVGFNQQQRIPLITTDAQYDALPMYSKYRAPDGSIRRKTATATGGVSTGDLDNDEDLDAGSSR